MRNQRNTTPEAGVTTAQQTTVWEGRTTEILSHSGRNVIWLKRHTHDLPPRSSIPSSTTGKAELCSPVHNKHLTTFCAKNGQSFIHSQGRIPHNSENDPTALHISMDGSHKTMVSDKIETEKNPGSDASQKNYITSPIGTILLRGIYIGGEAIR